MGGKIVQGKVWLKSDLPYINEMVNTFPRTALIGSASKGVKDSYGDIDILSSNPKFEMPHAAVLRDENGTRKTYELWGRQVDVITVDERLFGWCKESLAGSNDEYPAWARNDLMRAIAATEASIVITDLEDEHDEIIGRAGWSWLISGGMTWRCRMRTQRHRGTGRVKAMKVVPVEMFSETLRQYMPGSPFAVPKLTEHYNIKEAYESLVRRTYDPNTFGYKSLIEIVREWDPRRVEQVVRVFKKILKAEHKTMDIEAHLGYSESTQRENIMTDANKLNILTAEVEYLRAQCKVLASYLRLASQLSDATIMSIEALIEPTMMTGGTLEMARSAIRTHEDLRCAIDGLNLHD